MIKLYINNVKVDLDKDTKILLNKSFNNYNNPTIVKNSFSKTISLPSTKTNDELFDYIYKFDRKSTGNVFNASKRVPFSLISDDGSLIEKGYIKLDNIKLNDKSNNKLTYNITLYGELGNILYGLTYKSLDSDEKLTLADLIYDIDLSFNIDRNFVNNCWNRLKNPTGAKQIGDIINFAITYDGIPEVANFDFNKCFTTYNSNYSSKLMYLDKDNTLTQLAGLPRAFDKNGNISDITSPNAYYTMADLKTNNIIVNFGLFESDNDLTGLEVKDLRSYLLRPVIKFKEILRGISNYLSKNYGYVLVYDNNVINQTELNETWMTLNCLWESNENIKSGDFISQKQLLGETSEPSSYLISFIKTYGLFINVDIYNKVVYITNRKNFYDGGVKKLIVNENSERIVTPLTFDKNSYTFDYAESELDIIKNYKETYNKQYGSKIVRTGYQFDYESKKYIDNNIFRQGVDTVDGSDYFTYNNVPSPLMPYFSSAKYSLFREEKDGVINKYTNTIKCIPGLNNSTFSSTNIKTLGPRYALNVQSAQLNPYIYYDYIPRLKCCNSGGSPVDCSNILIRFNGFVTPNIYNTNATDIIKNGNIGDQQDTFGLSYFFESDNTFKVSLSDDCLLEYNDGKRCWVYSDIVNLFTIYRTDIPMFARSKYNFQFSNAYYMQDRFPSNWYVDNGLINSTVNGLAYEHNSENQGGPYYNFTLKAGSTVGLVYNIEFSDQPDYDYIYFDNPNVKLISKTNITDYGNYRNGAAIYYVDSDTNITCRMYAGRISVANSHIYLSTLKIYYMNEYDSLKNIKNANDLIPILGITKGYSFGVNETYDFAHSPIKFSDYIIPNYMSDIYDRYWKYYIEELYNIDNKILNCEIIIDNIYDAFNKIYWYDNSYWILSDITDYDFETRKCKAKLIKVIDKTVYNITYISPTYTDPSLSFRFSDGSIRKQITVGNSGLPSSLDDFSYTYENGKIKLNGIEQGNYYGKRDDLKPLEISINGKEFTSNPNWIDIMTNFPITYTLKLYYKQGDPMLNSDGTIYQGAQPAGYIISNPVQIDPITSVNKICYYGNDENVNSGNLDTISNKKSVTIPDFVNGVAITDEFTLLSEVLNNRHQCVAVPIEYDGKFELQYYDIIVGDWCTYKMHPPKPLDQSIYHKIDGEISYNGETYYKYATVKIESGKVARCRLKFTK